MALSTLLRCSPSSQPCPIHSINSLLCKRFSVSAVCSEFLMGSENFIPLKHERNLFDKQQLAFQHVLAAHVDDNIHARFLSYEDARILCKPPSPEGEGCIVLQLKNCAGNMRAVYFARCSLGGESKPHKNSTCVQVTVLPATTVWTGKGVFPSCAEVSTNTTGARCKGGQTSTP